MGCCQVPLYSACDRAEGVGLQVKCSTSRANFVICGSITSPNDNQATGEGARDLNLVQIPYQGASDIAWYKLSCRYRLAVGRQNLRKLKNKTLPL